MYFDTWTKYLQVTSWFPFRNFALLSRWARKPKKRWSGPSCFLWRQLQRFVSFTASKTLHYQLRRFLITSSNFYLHHIFVVLHSSLIKNSYFRINKCFSMWPGIWSQFRLSEMRDSSPTSKRFEIVYNLLTYNCFCFLSVSFAGWADVGDGETEGIAH